MKRKEEISFVLVIMILLLSNFSKAVSLFGAISFLLFVVEWITKEIKTTIRKHKKTHSRRES